MKKFLVFTAFSFISIQASFSQASLLESKSHINWITRDFKSNITLDVDKAGINMPSGKSIAANMINTRVPDMIKDPLLTLNVDSRRKLGDLILEQKITYHDLADVITSSSCTIGYFKKDSSLFTTNHNIKTSDISSLFVKHSAPYRQQKPIEQIASKPFTGIIIDARGQLGVHGEFSKEEAEPCFFPRVFSDEMNVIFEKNMVLPDIIIKGGICQYDFSDDESKYKNLIGNRPLHILATEIFGENRSDIVIKKEDALRIISVPENLDLLKNGKVVILLNKEKLIYDVSAPLKDDLYYTDLQKLKFYDIPDFLKPDSIDDGPDGLRFLYNLKFIPDSPELLPNEKSRIRACAEMIKEMLKNNSYSIFIEGHTADIGQPENQQQLSNERARSIIELLVREGLDRDLFSYRGYGATVPAEGGDNSTNEGRAVNRRVEIKLRPKTTYIQRTN
ncbi:MAG: OmpA family protein [Treponema sp.]|nr:OmpA family protein [Candidatus Treponema merdequi]